MKATGLPSAYCHSAIGQYKFWGQSNPITFNASQLHFPSSVESDVELEFNHTEVMR